MRLLVVTQKVDRDDPILGFFDGWIRSFSRVFASIVVIGQVVGRHQEFPRNVAVHSLEKERGRSRASQIVRFWILLWRMRNHYDVIFVHMTPIWVILGAPIGWLLRKRMYLWYEARGGGWSLRLAMVFVQKIFSASDHGMPVRTAKNIVTGHGIDTDKFSFGGGMRDPYLILAVGRITQSKRLPLLLEAFAGLSDAYRLVIAGKTITPEDDVLLRRMRIDCEHRGIVPRIEIQSFTQEELIGYLQSASLLIHASETALDKAVLEAMACGCIVVSCAEAAYGVLPTRCMATPDTLHDVMRRILALSSDEKESLQKELRKIVVDYHGLEKLSVRLHAEMEPKISAIS